MHHLTQLIEVTDPHSHLWLDQTSTVHALFTYNSITIVGTSTTRFLTLYLLKNDAWTLALPLTMAVQGTMDWGIDDLNLSHKGYGTLGPWNLKSSFLSLPICSVCTYSKVSHTYPGCFFPFILGVGKGSGTPAIVNAAFASTLVGINDN